MWWKVTYQIRDQSLPPETVQVEAETSRQALETVALRLPAGHEVLFIRRTGNQTRS